MSNKLQFLSSSTFPTFVTSALVKALGVVSALLFLARPHVEAAEPVTMITYQPKEVRNTEAAIKQAQVAYEQVAWNPTIATLPQRVQLEQATRQVEAARAPYDKIAQGATADVVNGIYVFNYPTTSEKG